MNTLRSAAIAALAPLLAATPAIAQTAPGAAPERNILTWPMPDTVSLEGRAMAKAMGAMKMPDPMPPVPLQRQIIGGMYSP